MSVYMSEKNLDWFSILNEIGSDGLDEDFEVFKCNKCGSVYLMDYEYFYVFFDSKDLSKVIDIKDFFCVCCGYFLGNETVVGPKSDKCFKVTVDEFKKSNWRRFLRNKELGSA